MKPVKKLIKKNLTTENCSERSCQALETARYGSYRLRQVTSESFRQLQCFDSSYYGSHVGGTSKGRL